MWRAARSRAVASATHAATACVAPSAVPHALPAALLHAARCFSTRARPPRSWHARRHVSANDDGGDLRELTAAELAGERGHAAADDEVEQPEGEEAESDAALWRAISSRDHSLAKPRVGSVAAAPSAASPHSSRARGAQQSSPPRQQQQEQHDDDEQREIEPERESNRASRSRSSAADEYKPYRPYSEPISAASADGWSSGASKPRYTSSRSTPAQLAWKRQQKLRTGNGGAADDEAPRAKSRAESAEERDAAARARFAQRHGLSSSSTSSASSSTAATNPPPSSSNPAAATTQPRGWADASWDSSSFASRGSSMPASASAAEPTRRPASAARARNDWGPLIGARREEARQSDSAPRREKDENEEDVDEADWSPPPRAPRHFRDGPPSDMPPVPRGMGGCRSFGDRRRHEPSAGGRREREGQRERRADSQREWASEREWAGGRGARMRSKAMQEGEEGSADLPLERLSHPRGELLYGFHPVLAALHAGRRSFHRLYVQEAKSERGNVRADKQVARVVQLAQSRGVPVAYASKHALNLAADQRPHNGFVLDCEPLQPDTITAPAQLDALAAEATSSASQVWLLLDQVVDPQNLGAILRSACYFGVSGVLLCAKNSAPLSPTSSKASSGAQEALRISHVTSTPRLLRKLDRAKWSVVGLSVAKGSRDLREIGAQWRKERAAAAAVGEAATAADSSASASASVPPPRHLLLVVGNEGRGMRPLVERACDTLARIVPGPVTAHADLAVASIGQPLIDADEEADEDAAEDERTNALTEHQRREHAYLQQHADAVNREEEAEMCDSLTTSDTQHDSPATAGQVTASASTRPLVDSLNVSNALAVALYELAR